MNKNHYLLMQKCGVADAYYGDRVNALIRTRYSLSEELSLLRRRDEAPLAFAEYAAFAEACKERVRQELAEVTP